MTKYYIISIDSLITTFSRVESGKEFDFSIKTENTNLEDEAIAVGDKILATIDDKVYYNFVVNEVSIGSLNLKKTFEIEKGIGLTSDKIGNFEIISQENYNSICTKLFSDFSIINSDNNNKKTDAIKIILNDKYTGRFVYKVLDFLYKADKLDKISKYFIKNADPLYTSIKTDEVSLTSIFKTSKDLLKKEDLTFNDGKPRFFEDIIFNKEDENYYLSTEWTSGKGSRLDLDSFKLLLRNYYPEYSIYEDKGEYYFSDYFSTTSNIPQIIFEYKNFEIKAKESRLNFSSELVLRFIASLTSKPFVILSGLSGSGKTKIAQSFVQWICESNEQYKIVPVGADWTNREPLVGYPNGLVAEEYIMPDSGVIHLLIEAVKNGNENKPFFLILDEMNLSHVERYFADFLSIMESNDSIKLYTGKERSSLDKIQIPREIGWPKNVFIIGTVNIDETTYMFSPKVLDRANVIEFRITEKEIESFLANPGIPDLTKLTKQGVSMSESFLSIASQNSIVKNEVIADELVSFFSQLQQVSAEFGYRSAREIMQLAANLKILEPTISDNACLDIAIMQKLLPKIHGSRSKLVNVLIALGEICLVDAQDCKTIYFDAVKIDDLMTNPNIKYPISFEKLIRMYKNVLANGFTSYAEA
jgi:hypothetical protein